MSEIEDTELVRRRAARLSELLRAIDPAEEQIEASARAIRAQMTRPRRSRTWQMAAAITLLLLGTLAVPEARAWVALQLRGIAGLIDAETTAPVPDDPPAVPSVPEMTVAFVVSRDTFDVHTRHALGRMVVTRTAQEQASAAAFNAPAASFVVLSNGLRIEGPPSPGGSYRIAVPERVRVVRVTNAGRPAALYTIPVTGEVIIDLAIR